MVFSNYLNEYILVSFYLFYFKFVLCKWCENSLKVYVQCCHEFNSIYLFNSLLSWTNKHFKRHNKLFVHSIKKTFARYAEIYLLYDFMRQKKLDRICDIDSFSHQFFQVIKSLSKFDCYFSEIFFAQTNLYQLYQLFPSFFVTCSTWRFTQTMKKTL